MTNRQRLIRKNILIYATLVIVIIIVDFPIYWMLKSSVTPLDQIMTRDVSLGVSSWDFSSYYKVWTGTDYASQLQFRRYLLNSAVVVLASVAISIVIALLASYSLSRFKYRHRDGIAQGILYVYMFPQMVLTTPLLSLVINLGLYNNLLSLVIVYCTFSLPYSIWMMRSYFNELPKDLEEAAMVDGCNRIQAITKIMLPLALPGVVATVTYSFILGWNNVIYPLCFVSDDAKKLVSVGFLSLAAGDMTPWNGVMAAATLSSLPVVALFMFLQKYLIGGLAAGGVKG
jgi:multiple sugar transport system permease protein